MIYKKRFVEPKKFRTLVAILTEHNRAVGNNHAWLERTGLNTTNWDCADTLNNVDVPIVETVREAAEINVVVEQTEDEEFALGLLALTINS